MNSTAPSPALSVPAGFVPVKDVVMADLPASLFQGPTETGEGWQIAATFTFENGIELEIQPAIGDYSRRVGIGAFIWNLRGQVSATVLNRWLSLRRTPLFGA